MKILFNVLVALTVVLLGYGFCQAIFIAPTEATMGDVQRIFYYHLPSAWVAFLLFFVNFLASIGYLVRRNLGADALALASAEVGVSFCTIVLLTGPIWARPIWGIWWTWDARLTSTLVLWLIYVSYLVLLHGHPMVSHPASPARDRRRPGFGIGPPHVGRRPVEPCRLRHAGPALRLGTLPAGASRSRIGRGPRPGLARSRGDTMNASSNAYLYAAYIVVWVVHVLYAFTLLSRAKRMKREQRELR